MADSDSRQEEAKHSLEEQRKLTQRDLEELGAVRQRVCSTPATSFANLYAGIGKVDQTPMRRNNTKPEYQQAHGSVA